MQSGKQELRPRFEELGWRFVDLNDLVDELHRRDQATFYAQLGLAPYLQDSGRETADYYRMIAEDFSLHRAAQDHELSYVIQRLRDLWPQLEGRVVVNWGYVYQLIRHLPFDHVMVFEAGRSVWCERVRRACRRIGWSDTDMTDAQIDQFARAIEMEPTEISACAREIMPERWSTFDTSAEDWGASSLEQALAAINNL